METLGPIPEILFDERSFLIFFDFNGIEYDYQFEEDSGGQPYPLAKDL